jgi:hypothetical protein
MAFLEDIACGRPAITYVSSKFPEYEEFPLKIEKPMKKLPVLY